VALSNCTCWNRRNQTLVDIVTKRLVVLSRGTDDAPRQKVAKSSGFGFVRTFWSSVVAVFIWTVTAAVIGRYCNMDNCLPPSPQAKLNTTGHVLVAKRDLKWGHVIRPADCTHVVLPLFRTPPYAISSDAKLDHLVATVAVSKGGVITADNAVMHSVGLADIISIKSVSESEPRLSQLKEPEKPVLESIVAGVTRPQGQQQKSGDRAGGHQGSDLSKLPGYPVEQDLLQAKFLNKQKQFDRALKCANDALSKLTAITKVSRSGVAEKAASFDSIEKLVTANPMRYDEGWRAIIIEILMQRGLAEDGLTHANAAQSDRRSALKIFSTMHQDWLHNRNEYYVEPANFRDLDNLSISPYDDSTSDDVKSDDSHPSGSELKVANSRAAKSKQGKSRHGKSKGTKSDNSKSEDTKSDDEQADHSKSAGSKSDDASDLNPVDLESAEPYLKMLAGADEERYREFERLLKSTGKVR